MEFLAPLLLGVEQTTGLRVTYPHAIFQNTICRCFSLLPLFWVALRGNAMRGGCAYEGPKAVSSSGNLQFVLHVSPPLQTGVVGKAYNGVLVYSSAGIDLLWDGSAETEPFKKWESESIEVLRGSQIQSTILLANYFDLSCREVKIESFLDGRLVDSRTYEMGLLDFNGPGCTNGRSLEYRFFVP